MAEKLIREDMFSAIDPSLTSYVSNKKEILIPELPVTINQNKKLISIWFEAKKILEEEIKNQSKKISED